MSITPILFLHKQPTFSVCGQ